MRRRFMNIKCDILAQDENLGPEFHENEIVKFLHRMKAWSLSFMSATLGYQKRSAKVFIGCSLYLIHHFY